MAVLVAPGDGCRLGIALRVGKHATVQVVGVRGNLDKAGTLHLAHFLPGDEILPWLRRAVVVDGTARRHIEPAANQCSQCRIVEEAQQGQYPRVDVPAAVVEGEQHGLGRQCRPALTGIEDLLQADRPVAVGLQPGELGSEVTRGDRCLCQAGRTIALDLVIAERNEIRR